MSRRKQSNPKSFKSDTENTSQVQEEITTDLTLDAMSEHSSKEAKSGDDWDSDRESHTEELKENSTKFTSNSPDKRCSPPMASSDRRSSSVSPVQCPSVSFADLPKVLASNSYLAAALKASVITSHAVSAGGAGGEIPIKREGSFSPTKLAESFAASSFLNPTSLSEAALSAATLTSSLLKNSAGDPNHLTSMLQGIPLFSSVLPALQRLVPGTPMSIPQSQRGIICVCGVKFNSTSNLDAHRTFYCSHRQGLSNESRSDRKDESSSPSREQDDEENSRTLKCPHCPYTTTHKLSLNGHMNIHTNPEETSNTAAFAASIDPKAQERYCSDCDIQFSSMKTFKVHKAHYCQTRHVLKASKSPVREDHSSSHLNVQNLSSIVSALSGGSNPVIAVPTNPVLLLPLSFLVGAHILPSQVLPQPNPAFMLPNGQLHPINAITAQSNSSASIPPPLLSPGAIAAAAALLASTTSLSVQSLTSSPTEKSECSFRSKISKEEETFSRKRRIEGDSPLDLTTKRPKISIKGDYDEEKENRETNNSITVRSPASMKSHFGEGEFEGKLLASPPRLSPMDEDNKSPSIGRSPRPTSTLCSPTSESPRPSTSAMSNASRSPPGQIPSTVPPGLTALPPGFPNPLVSTLESLGSSLPLASLQCLQSLQNVPRELALKLINPELLMNGIPPMVINPPAIVKQGQAKCDQCNIIFFKEESLQIHKKHYCQSRESKKSNDDDRGPSADRSPPNRADTVGSPLQSPGHETTSAPPPPAIPKENCKSLKALLQFVCTACGIKFSSPDNLTAHQTYYCSKREGANEEGVVAKGVWRCPRCRNMMAETLQAAHQCVTPTPSSSHGWKCPCCPVLSPTAAAAQKHLETHAGIKAFRCTICGYRGNTLRGMRTHIRMHFEKRTNDLQEENFIACILEDNEPRSANRINAANDTRKLLDSTKLLLETSALSSLLGTDPSSLAEATAETPFSCNFCPFVTTVRSTLLQHLTVAHNIGLETKLSIEIKNLLEAKVAASKVNNNNLKDVENGARDTNSSPPAISSIKLEPDVKIEVEDQDDDSVKSPGEESARKSPTVILPKASPPASNGVCYCQTCNISFTLLDSYVAHKRFYCTRPESNTPPETTVQ